MSEQLLERESIIYQEMLSHPALFSHPKPQKVIVIGDTQGGILLEVLKHPSVIELQLITPDSTVLALSDDPRIQCKLDDLNVWVEQTHDDHFDIIIVAEEMKTDYLAHFFNILHTDGILIHKSHSPFEVNTIKHQQQSLLTTGFHDVQPLHFPQPSYHTGWRTALMAKKQGLFRKIREKDIFNKTFPTHYYNYDVHKAGLALPEFLREELITS